LDFYRRRQGREVNRWANSGLAPIAVAIVSPGSRVVGSFLLGVVMAPDAEHRQGITDHQAIVIDEIVGMVLALFAVPIQGRYIGVGFCLFGGLDILKAIGALERLLGSREIMCE
jgi:phosphatidylglycerophosphatase A